MNETELRDHNDDAVLAADAHGKRKVASSLGGEIERELLLAERGGRILGGANSLGDLDDVD